jgi:hypothetical protein
MEDHLAPVFVNKKLVKDLSLPKPTVAQVLEVTGRDPSKFDVFRLKSEDDETGEPIELTAVLDRTASDKPIYLRAVPKDRNVGDSSIPSRLLEDAEVLRASHLQISLAAEGPRVFATFAAFPLPSHRFNKPRTDLLVIVPLPYPEAKLDMFYVEPDLMLLNGSIPRGAEVIEPHMGRNWRRFSWHTNTWNPAVDDLASHVGMIEQRLREVD